MERRVAEAGPIVKIVGAVLVQAVADGAKQVLIDFNNPEHKFEVSYLSQDVWSQMMAGPWEIGDRFRRALLRAVEEGYDQYKRDFWPSERMPKSVELEWKGPDLLLLTLKSE